MAKVKYNQPVLVALVLVQFLIITTLVVTIVHTSACTSMQTAAPTGLHSPALGNAIVPAQSVPDSDACGPNSKSITELFEFGMKRSKVADKLFDHAYTNMYGIFLFPKRHETFKMLEIGFGCGMSAGPGASSILWVELFQRADLWFAELDAECVKQAGLLGKIPPPLLSKVVTGDQGDKEVVQGWIAKTGGAFDVIIDDGGHKNPQILTSFELLWPTLNAGGLYFIEDVHVGRHGQWRGPQSGPVVSDVIQAWIEQLLIVGEHTLPSAKKHPLPAKVKFIFCQFEACVIAKCRASDTSHACREGFTGLGDFKNNFPQGWQKQI